MPVVTASSLRAPIVAILDDDVGPAALGARAFVNPGEIAGNGVDDDGNGVVDDVHGALFTQRFGPAGALNGEALGSVATSAYSTMDYGGHGSIVADIAVRALDTVDPAGAARVMGVGFAITTPTLAGFERSVDYLVDMKRRGNAIRVANASLGFVERNPANHARWRAAVEKLRAADIVLVCAASENKASLPYTPSISPDMPGALGLDNVVTVGAHDASGQRPSWSAAADVLAPGVDINARSIEGYRIRATGTSMAAPQVSAALAAWFTAYPTATAAQAKAALLSSSSSSSSNGALDVRALLATPPR